MKFNAAFVFFKKNNYSVIEQNALSSNYMENILKGSLPKLTGQNERQDESLTGQVHDQAGHCPLTGRFFEPKRQFFLEYSLG